MANATYTDIPTTAAAPRGSLFKRALNALVRSRMREVDLHVNYHLARLDDRSLAEMGLTRDEVMKRDRAPMPYTF